MCLQHHDFLAFMIIIITRVDSFVFTCLVLNKDIYIYKIKFKTNLFYDLIQN